MRHNMIMKKIYLQIIMIFGSTNYLEPNLNSIPKFQLNGKKLGTFSSNIYSVERKKADFIDIFDFFLILCSYYFDGKLPFLLFNDYRPPLLIFSLLVNMLLLEPQSVL